MEVGSLHDLEGGVIGFEGLIHFWARFRFEDESMSSHRCTWVWVSAIICGLAMGVVWV